MVHVEGRDYRTIIINKPLDPLNKVWSVWVSLGIPDRFDLNGPMKLWWRQTIVKTYLISIVISRVIMKDFYLALDQ